MIEVHPAAKVSKLADIEDSVRGSTIQIGEGAVIDSFVKIKPAGGNGNVVIGTKTVINSGTVIYTGHGVNIGAYVSVAANCTFAATNHAYQKRDQLIQEQGFLDSKGGIIIKDDVWIGAGCIFLDGTYVEEGCVIAAGSVVKGKLNAYGVYGGSPLKRLKERN